MQLRDIVNRDIINLENCESEPIHIPGSIQPHGFLLFVEGPDFRITYCSANVTAYCGIPPAEMLGKSFAGVFGTDTGDQLSAYLYSEAFASGNPIGLVLGPERYSCAVHAQPAGWMINAEPYPDGYLNPPDLYQQTRRFVSRLEQTDSMEELCQFVADETRQLTGYDRVMIYRFDEAYNGEVIAEAAAAQLEPFLGLHYPHTDIPAQARALYLTNLMRMITDVHYEPVPILTMEDGQHRTLDLSYAVLRSVSPIHIAYLKNMGVGATLTISLVHNQKLWGLIACHHYSPKNIPHYTRLTAQLQGHFLSSQIAVRQSAANFSESQQIAHSLKQVLLHIGNMEASLMANLLQPAVLDLARATGLMLSFQGKWYTYGETPEETAVAALAPFLQKAATGGVLVSHALSRDFPQAESIAATASGLIFHELGAGPHNFIIWFRKENKRMITWAGDPSRAIIKDEKGLSPRKSFEQWQELVSGQSEPWTEAEQHAAATLAHSLQKQLNYVLLQAEEKRNREQSELLRQAYSELESINWISMHDLQEPLRKIQIFASRLEARSTNEQECHASADDARRIFTNARRMQDLIQDMQVFARLNTHELTLAPLSLNQLLDELMQDFTDEFTQNRAFLHLDPLPEILGNAFLLRQLFSNLITNALKFAHPGRTLRLSVVNGPEGILLPPAVALRPDDYHLITLQDNGIGFDEAHALEIFGIFRRLHAKEEYEGTGVGLAICKKIMQLHGGAIAAAGMENEGARFLLCFPK